MKNIFFIYPNPNKTNPRGIRVNNIINELQNIAPENSYNLLSFSDSFQKKNSNFLKINSFNLLYLFLRYTGVFKYGRKLVSKAKVLDPYLFTHSLVKLDLRLRLRKLNSKDCLFVVVVSPFSNYLLVPWLKKNYPRAKVVCDIGDPLYKNSVRKRDETLTRDIECSAVKIADYLIVTNTATSKHLANEYNVDPKLIAVIPQGVNIDLIIKAKKATKEVEKNTLVYAGSFYDGLRSPKALFDFLETQDKFKIHIFGGQIDQSNKQIVFEGRLGQEALFKQIQSKQIIVYIDNKFGIQTSGKIYEVLSFKKPILFIKGKENSLPFLLAKQYPNVFFTDDNHKSIGEILKHISTLENIDFVNNIYSHGWNFSAENFLAVINSIEK